MASTAGKTFRVSIPHVEPQFELLTSSGGEPGDLGFKLTGEAEEGDAMCRVWLRRTKSWRRYLDPRRPEDSWDVLCYVRRDSAFALISEDGIHELDTLAERFEFPSNPAGLARLEANGHPLRDRVLAWAREVTGLDDAGDDAIAAVAADESEAGGAPPVADDVEESAEPPGEVAGPTSADAGETVDEAEPMAAAGPTDTDAPARGVEADTVPSTEPAVSEGEGGEDATGDKTGDA